MASATVEQLRSRIRAIETPDSWRVRVATFGEGAVEVNRALPLGGVPLGCLHEIVGMAEAATGFAAAMVVRLPDCNAPVLWCRRAGSDREHGELYAPGLLDFGLRPERLLLARAPNADGVLWAMEEGLRQSGLAAVVGEMDDIDFTASRRLQLAAETAGVTALLLRPQASPAVTAAVTRWHVVARPGEDKSGRGFGGPRWRVELARCRGGAPGIWDLEWHNATADFAVAAGFRDGSAERHRTQMAS